MINRIQNQIDKGVAENSSEISDETLEDINAMLGLNFKNVKEVSSHDEAYPHENGVFILNDNNFDDFITNNTYVLVEFYARKYYLI